MEQEKRIYLEDVSLMRTILAVLIVFMHAFTIYNGCWAEPAGYVDIPLYKWLSRFSFAFSLESFVIISGYIFGFQIITLKKKTSFFKFIINKAKRLLLPSIIFSCLYFLMFLDYNGFGNFLYSVFNGCGHMWFLPMLFWCFVGGWLVVSLKISDFWKLALLFFLNLFSVVTIPFRISSASLFLFYFYLGYLLYKNVETIKLYLDNRKLFFLVWIIFFFAFFILRPLQEYLTLDTSHSLFIRFVSLVGSHLCQLIYATIGSVAFYYSSLYLVNKKPLSAVTIKISSCCFGVYLFQQFVLEFLYYHCCLPTIVGPYWLPWIGFISALTVSFLLSIILLRTRFGRFLIG